MTDEEEQRYNELLQRAVMAEDLVETMARQGQVGDVGPLVERLEPLLVHTGHALGALLASG